MVDQPVRAEPAAGLLVGLYAPAAGDVSYNGVSTRALRLSAVIGMFNSARWSALKKASKRPRSRVWMKRVRWAKLKLASG